MKIVIYILTFISFTVLLTTTVKCVEQCDVYKCLDDLNVSNELICRLTMYDDVTQITTHHVRKCNNNMKCKEEINEGALCTNVFVPKNEHERCDMNFECNSNICVNNTCSVYPLTHKCERSMNCNNNAYCYNGVCTSLLQPYDTCDTSAGCPFGYACGKTSSNDANSKCYLMFTIKHGDYSSESLLCESGMLINNTCVDTAYATNSNNDVKRCTSNNECEFVMLLKGNETTSKDGKCVCSKNGERYCEFASLSKQWKAFLTVFHEEVKAYKANTTHVAHYRNGIDINDVTSSWFNNKRIQTAFRNAKAEYYDTLNCVHEYEGYSYSYYIKPRITLLLAVVVVMLNIF